MPCYLHHNSNNVFLVQSSPKNKGSNITPGIEELSLISKLPSCKESFLAAKGM